MSFVKHASNNTIANMSMAIMALVASALTARFLGPEGRGFYAVFFTAAGLLSQLFYLGITQANVYYLGREKKPYDKIVGNSLLFVCVQGVLLGIVLAAFPSLVASFLPSSMPMTVIAMLWGMTMLQMCCDIYLGILMGRKYFALYAMNTVVTGVGMLLASLTVLFYPDNVELVVFARFVVFLLTVFVFLFLIARKTRPVPSVSLSLLKLQLRFGIKNYVQILVGTLNYRLYLLALSFMIGSSAAGIFSVAMLFAEVIRLLPSAVVPIMLPYLTTEHDEVAHKHLTARICRQVLFIVFSGMVVMMPLIPYVLHYVFGEEYASALNAIRVMVCGAFLGIIAQMLSEHFTSLHKQAYSIKAGVLALVVAVVSTFSLIPNYGIMGGATAYLLSNLTASSCMIFFYCRTTGVKSTNLLIIQKNDFVEGAQFIKGLLQKRAKQ